MRNIDTEAGQSFQNSQINLEDLRPHALLNIFGSPIYGADDKYIFYYDETNNVRSLYLTDKGTNAEFKNFVIGGIVHPACKTIDNAEELISALSLQKTAKEIKFRQLATGDFLGVLNSKKIKTFLKWLLDNDIYIHYSNFNTFYWSIVDIIDSLWSHPPLKGLMQYASELKNELFRLSSFNKPEFLKILKKFNYPNISHHKRHDFLKELLEYFRLIDTEPSSFIMKKFLIYMFKEAKNINKLDFLVENENNILIKNFFHQYLRPMYIYPNSVHIFDEEKKIQKEFASLYIKFNSENLDFKFVKSIDCLETQLSDVVCGLMGSYFSYIEENSIQTLLANRANLNERQSETLHLLRLLIEKSDAISNGFFYRVAPLDSDAKSNTFLFDFDPPDFLFTYDE